MSPASSTTWKNTLVKKIFPLVISRSPWWRLHHHLSQSSLTTITIDHLHISSSSAIPPTFRRGAQFPPFATSYLAPKNGANVFRQPQFTITLCLWCLRIENYPQKVSTSISPVLAMREVGPKRCNFKKRFRIMLIGYSIPGNGENWLYIQYIQWAPGRYDWEPPNPEFRENTMCGIQT